MVKKRRYTVHAISEQKVMEVAIAYAKLFGDVHVTRTYIGKDLSGMKYEIEATEFQFAYIDDAFNLAL